VAVKVFGNDAAENGVPEEFQAFIVFSGITAVGKSLLQQFRLLEHIPEFPAQRTAAQRFMCLPAVYIICLHCSD